MFKFGARLVSVFLLAILILGCPPAAQGATPPAHITAGILRMLGDNAAVSGIACAPVQVSDTLYTVKCRTLVSENGVLVATFDVPMNGTGGATWAHAPLVGTPGSTTTISVSIQQFGVNRSGQLSAGTTSVLTSAPIIIADGAPSAPKAVGGTLKFCPAGSACP